MSCSEKTKQNTVTASDSSIKYKSIIGRLKEHFEFRLSGDSIKHWLWRTFASCTDI